MSFRYWAVEKYFRCGMQAVLCVAKHWTVRGSNTVRSKRAFSSQKHPNRLWGPLILLFIGYWGVFTRGKEAGTCVGHSTLSILLPRLLLMPSVPSWQAQVQLYFWKNCLISKYLICADSIHFKYHWNVVLTEYICMISPDVYEGITSLCTAEIPISIGLRNNSKNSRTDNIYIYGVFLLYL